MIGSVLSRIGVIDTWAHQEVGTATLGASAGVVANGTVNSHAGNLLASSGITAVGTARILDASASLDAEATFYTDYTPAPPGDGTSSLPYLLYTEEHLFWFTSEARLNNNHYWKLMRDIKVETWRGGYVESGGNSFYGNFDGNWHELDFTGRTITATGTYDIGAIGYINSSTVERLGVRGGRWVGGSSTYGGGIASYIYRGTIRDCYVIDCVIDCGRPGGIAGVASNSLSPRIQRVVSTAVLDTEFDIGSYGGGAIGYTTEAGIADAVYWDYEKWNGPKGAQSNGYASYQADMYPHTTEELKDPTTYADPAWSWQFRAISPTDGVPTFSPFPAGASLDGVSAATAEVTPPTITAVATFAAEGGMRAALIVRQAIGGTEHFIDGYRYHEFTEDDTLIVGQQVTVDFALVGGGGGGGNRQGGGGGGGDVVDRTAVVLVPGSYPVTVGEGGLGGSYGDGSPGGASTFNGLTAPGGGGGGSRDGTGVGGNGASGGGGAKGQSGGTATGEAGSAGGAGDTFPEFAGGGGGASGVAGSDGALGQAGHGADGFEVTQFATFGVSGWFGAGGGGAALDGKGGDGGQGGGGKGGDDGLANEPDHTVQGEPGVDGTGSGGGGTAHGATGNRGGRGTLLVRYPAVVATVPGAASPGGSGGVTAVGWSQQYLQASLGGSAGVIAVSTVNLTALVQSTGSLTASALVTTLGAATLSGPGVLVAAGITIDLGVATLGGVGSLTASGTVAKIGAATSSGTAATTCSMSVV